MKHFNSIFFNSVIVVKSGHLKSGVTDPSVAKTETFLTDVSKTCYSINKNYSNK